MQGYAVDGLVDFTGGVAERLEISRYDLDHAPTKKRLFEKLVSSTADPWIIYNVISRPTRVVLQASCIL